MLDVSYAHATPFHLPFTIVTAANMVEVLNSGKE